MAKENRPHLAIGALILVGVVAGIAFLKDELPRTPLELHEQDESVENSSWKLGYNENIARELVVLPSHTSSVPTNQKERGQGELIILDRRTQEPASGTLWRVKPKDGNNSSIDWECGAKSDSLELAPGRYVLESVSDSWAASDEVIISTAEPTFVWALPKWDLNLEIRNSSDSPILGVHCHFHSERTTKIGDRNELTGISDAQGKISFLDLDCENGRLIVWTRNYLVKELPIKGGEDVFLVLQLQPVHGVQNAREILVLDALTQNPIEGASFRYGDMKEPLGMATDKDGKAVVPEFERHRTLIISKYGYFSEKFDAASQSQPVVFLKPLVPLTLVVANSSTFPVDVLVAIENNEAKGDMWATKSDGIEEPPDVGFFHGAITEQKKELQIEVPAATSLQAWASNGVQFPKLLSVPPLYESRRLEFSLDSEFEPELKLFVVDEDNQPLTADVTFPRRRFGLGPGPRVEEIASGIFTCIGIRDTSWIRIDAEGYESALLRRRRTADVSFAGEVNVVLLKDHKVHGTIVDLSGRAYAGVRVALLPSTAAPTRSIPLAGAPGWMLFQGARGVGASAVTDLDGRFSLNGLGAGEYRLKLKPDFKMDSIPKGGTVEYVLNVPASGAIQVRCPRFVFVSVEAYDAQTKTPVPSICVTGPNDPLGLVEESGNRWQGWCLQDVLGYLKVRSKGYLPETIYPEYDRETKVWIARVDLRRAAPMTIQFRGSSAGDILGRTLDFTQFQQDGEEQHWAGWSGSVEVKSHVLEVALPLNEEWVRIRQITPNRNPRLKLAPAEFPWIPGGEVDIQVERNE